MPQFVTYSVQRWVLGPIYCVIMGQVGIVPVSVNTLTVLAITSYRLKVVLSPFRDITVSVARGIVACIWFTALIPMAVFASYHTKSEFQEKIGRCLTDIYDNDAARGPVMTCIGVIVILPLFAITGINLGLLGVAARHRSAGSSQSLPNFKALVMVCSLSGLFIVSWSPYLAFTFLKMRHPELPQVLDLIAFHFIFLNSFGNPILYTLTNRRFGAYIYTTLTRACRCVSLPEMSAGSNSGSAPSKIKASVSANVAGSSRATASTTQEATSKV